MGRKAGTGRIETGKRAVHPDRSGLLRILAHVDKPVLPDQARNARREKREQRAELPLAQAAILMASARTR